MNARQLARRVAVTSAALAALSLGACEKKAETGGAADAGHSHGAGEGHGHSHAGKHDLGTVAIGGFQVGAARYGDLAPGKETDVDITVGGGAGKPAAVRAWIGTEDGAGSMKARAESEPDHFHAHVEVPSPLPAGSKLWVEIEGADGQTTTGSFDLRQ